MPAEPGVPGGLWRASQRWYGIAAASWFVGAVGSAVSDGTGRSALSLSVPDLFYLVALVALVTGLVVPIRLPRDAGTRRPCRGHLCLRLRAVRARLGRAVRHLYHRSGESPTEFSWNCCIR